MEVKVEDGLARAATVIHDDAISGSQLAFRGQPGSEQQGAAKQSAVFFLRVGQRRDMLERADEDMRRGLRRDVFEGKRLGVFVHEFGRQFAFADLAEDTVIHAASLLRKGGESIIVKAVLCPEESLCITHYREIPPGDRKLGREMRDRRRTRNDTFSLSF